MGSKKSSKSRSQRLGAGYIFFICLCCAIILGFLIFAVLVSTNAVSCNDNASASGNVGGYIEQDPATGEYYFIDENGEKHDLILSGTDVYANEASESDATITVE